MRRTLPLVAAIVAGIAVLLIYFLPFQTGALTDLRRWLFNWAVILAAVALLVGVINLARAHTEKIFTLKGNWIYSLVLVGGLVAVIIFYLPALFVSLLRLVSPANPLLPTLEPAATQFGGIIQFIFVYVQTPIEAALGGLLAFILVLAGVRLVRRRKPIWGGVAFVGLAAALLFCGFLQPAVYAWLTEVVALGGARGLLLGMALGAAATGLRVIFGADQPYAE